MLTQDPLGVQAKRIIKGDHVDVYTRPVMPMFKEKTSVAVAFLNRWTEGTPLRVRMTLSDLGLDHEAGYRAADLMTGADLGPYKPGDTFTSLVNPTGILVVKFSVLPQNKFNSHNQPSDTSGTKVGKRCFTGLSIDS